MLGLRSSGLGRTIYAVGDNPIACRLAGVRVWQVLLAVYVMAGLLAAVGGLLFSGTTGSVGVDQTNSYLLPSVAATVIGGTSILGGIGRLHRHDPRRPHPHRAQPPAAAARRERGVQARCSTASSCSRWRGCTSGSPARRRARGADRSATIGVGVIGTGFMGVAHTEALRRLGVEVVGMVGSSPERARGQGGNPLLPPAVSTRSTSCSPIAGLDAVHITSPNHVHAEHGRAAIAAGKHVVCEKPLGVDAAETAELVALAADAGVVNAVCFNLRYYPQNQTRRGARRGRRDRRAAVRSPASYHQDWLLLDTDWNWRLDAARQGALRAVADIGSHWLDLVQFVSGQRVVEVFADLHTFVTERSHPAGEVETFGAAGVDADVPRVREQMESDDAAGLLLRFDGGARGVCTISQVSAGPQEHRLAWEIDGDDVGAGLGVRGPRAPVDRPPRPSQRDRREGPGALTPGGRRGAAYPGWPRRGLPGHVPRPVRRRVPRHRRRRAVGAARRTRRSPTATTSCRVRRDQRHRPAARHWAKVERTMTNDDEEVHR